MFSVALGDGSLREEAKLPACTGELHAAGDVLYLRGLPASCAGPSARRSQSRVSERYGDASIPLYRLDGDHWTLLPRLDESSYGLFTTEHDLWTISSISSIDERIRAEESHAERLTLVKSQAATALLSGRVRVPHTVLESEGDEVHGE